MTSEFVGTGSPLDQAGLDLVLELLKIEAECLWSVVTVETSGCGFTQDRKPRILFERHKFSFFTQGVYDKTNPDISNSQPGGYGAPSSQYDRLAVAVALNREAALKSASWGIGQIMGCNYNQAGYDNVESMVASMMESEANQLNAMGKFLTNGHLDEFLRQQNWAAYAKGYNGVNYKINKYDEKLSAAYTGFLDGTCPDLNVRSAQLLLTYLGYQPGAIDGIRGKNTDLALSKYLEHEQMQVNHDFDEGTLLALTQSVHGGPCGTPLSS